MTASTVARLMAFEPRPGRWHEWQSAEPVLAGRDFAAVRRELLDRDVSYEHKDAVLAALVRRSQYHNDNEARTAAIACLVPGALNIARRFVGALGREEAIAEALTSLCVHLDRLKLATRSDRIAIRALAGVRHHLARQATRECAWQQRLRGERALADLEEPAAVAVESSVLSPAVAAGVLNELDATLMEATRLRGLSLADAAALLGMTYDAAKKRRRRAEMAWIAWRAPTHRPIVSFAQREAA